MGATFTNKHRFFIQFMLNNGIVPKKDALRFFEEISPDEKTLADLKSLIIEINREISNHSFKIAPIVCEVTGEESFVWLNTKNDELSRLQSGFSALELEYFRAIMHEIITAEDHRILYPHAINIASTLTSNMTKDSGQKTLLRFFKGGYFVKKEENVYLGPRTILEFTTYLQTNTEDCICKLCSELVFTGDSCNSCTQTFHTFCLQKYLQSRDTCPSCKTAWGDPQSESMEVDSQPGPSHR